MPKVSIIIAVYNVEPYLRRSMDSLCNQTLEDIEIICINDASTDNSLAILRESEQKDKRVKVINLEQNSGAAVARNKGLDVATGEYLGFIDPDDEIVLNYYEELYKKAKEEDADIAKCKRKNINIDGTVSYTDLNDIIKEKGKYYFTYEWTTAIYRHKVITDNNIRFPEECRKAQDVVFLSRVIFKSDKIVLIGNVEYIYYKRNDSLNAKKIPLESIKSAIKARSLQVEVLNDSDLYEKDKNTYIGLYFQRIQVIFSLTLYQNDSIEAKRLCAQDIIELFHKCKDTKLLEEVFWYKHLLPLIKKKDVGGLTKIIKHYSCRKDALQKPLTFWQKIFSVTNQQSNNSWRKVITILGIKLKFKNKILEQNQRIKNLEKEISKQETLITNLKYKITTQQNKINNLSMISDKYSLLQEKEYNNIESKLEHIYSWQQNFYKDTPKEFPMVLTESEKQTLCKYFSTSENYLEFGAGGSTFLALENSKTNIFSVESDTNWLDYLRSYKNIRESEQAGRLAFYPIFIGKVKKWGFPTDDEYME